MLAHNKGALLIISIFIIHIIGLIHTENFKYAFSDIRIKLPLIILPIIISTSQPLTKKQVKYILMLFTGAVLGGTFVSTYILLFTKVTNIRDISLYISHIRFALLIDIAVFSMFWLIVSGQYALIKIEKIVIPIVITWLLAFLVLMHSVTGITVLAATSFMLSAVYIFRMKQRIYKLLLLVICLLIPAAVIIFMIRAVNAFYDTEQINFNELDSLTARGNPYFHDTSDKTIENGYYVGIYLCEKELKEEWNKRSPIKYDEQDKRKQWIKYTLIRYLTSKGLRKDAVGMKALTDKDVENIENGLANHIYADKYSISKRIYEIIWEIDVYMKGRSPDGHSVTQRIEYLRTGLAIAKDHFWIGVGTGDVQQMFDLYYNKTDSRLSDKWRLKTHNQWITFFITFGIFGLCWILFAFIYPVILSKHNADFLFIVCFIIIILSMFTEDTLEGQVGVSLVTFFYTLLLFGRNLKNHESKNKTAGINA